MYQPRDVIRIDLDLRAYNDLAEWIVIRGGMQRGGISVAHGCWRPTPEECDNAITRILEEVREQLFEVIATLYPTQLSFE